MQPFDDRLAAWQRRREARLNAHPRLRSLRGSGGTLSWYVADEILVVEEHRAVAERVLSEGGHGPAAGGYDELAPGLRRYRATELDVPRAVQELRGRVGARSRERARVAGPNHVLLQAPFYHGGPAGPPEPAPAPSLASRLTSATDVAKVAVLDTGVWRDSPLPPEQYIAYPADYESATDVDADGVLDGDVGHANFIAGIILGRTAEARLRMVKVLDTLGICTEAQLVAALLRLEDDVHIINLSLGGYTADDQPPLGLAFALDRVLRDRDRVAVAAAGNDGNGTNPFWPAALAGAGEDWSDQVVAVGAHDGVRPCGWSNSGDWVTLSALGKDLVSTFINHTPFDSGWARWSGTSFATPRVVAAIVEQMRAEGSAIAARARVLKDAGGHDFGGVPGLP